MEVGLPGHVTRHIIPNPTQETLERLTAAITVPGTWLKICAPVETVAPWIPGTWSVKVEEYMMTATLTRAAPRPRAVAPPGYTLAITTRSGVTVARLLTDDGEIAARGQFAVSGRTAVVDQVETAVNHRRRGLGTVIMRTLAATAWSAGARTGVLVATGEGQALYRTLGWSLHTEVTAAVLT
ncbi:GNAT family N-acetyltransferase [Nonomuraea sp. NN258]|nr:GNAT family N-acetyltransferase [Nonomuraea antri]